MLQVIRGRQAACRFWSRSWSRVACSWGERRWWRAPRAPALPLAGPSRQNTPLRRLDRSGVTRPPWASIPTGTNGSPGRPRPRPPPFGRAGSQRLSGNWAGLAQVGATYTARQRLVDRAESSSRPRRPAVSSSWIGIDGFSNQDLIQAGTEQDVFGGVSELLRLVGDPPGLGNEIGGVSPGDHMSASIFKVSGQHVDHRHLGPHLEPEFLPELHLQRGRGLGRVDRGDDVGVPGPATTGELRHRELHRPQLHDVPIRRPTRRR